MLSRSLAMTALCSALKPRAGPDGRSITYGRMGVDVGTAFQQPRRRQLTGVHSVLEGLVENLLLPARDGIESKHQIQGRRCVEHTVDDEGHRLVVLPRVDGVPGGEFEVVRDPAPGQGQLVDIAAVDLFEGRGFGARRVVAVETPVTISRDGPLQAVLQRTPSAATLAGSSRQNPPGS